MRRQFRRAKRHEQRWLLKDGIAHSAVVCRYSLRPPLLSTLSLIGCLSRRHKERRVGGYRRKDNADDANVM